MARQTRKEYEPLAARTDFMREASRASISRRWGPAGWRLLYPWWRQPPKVRILMYADGVVQFSGGSFGGLQHVITLLENCPYFYVDYDISTAHREGDRSATVKKAVRLTELDVMDKFDEIWFFGFRSVPALTDDELQLLDAFMAAPKFGGVLVTGDHGDLGKGLAGSIERAREMRRYPAAGTGRKVANTTLEEGRDENQRYTVSDQYDDSPQRLRLTPFPAPEVGRVLRPHPVMCGPDGPIDVFPDHGHEGEALAPQDVKGKPQWPTAPNGHQERPYVIARGSIKDPASDKSGQEVGVVSAYDGHAVGVGRIVADSSWHHWFDNNLLGVFFPPSPYAGFDATPAGQAVLKKLEAYFLNCGAWLAPPGLQAETRLTAWWSILWTDEIVELPPDALLRDLGEEAIRALSLRASVCAATDWALGAPAFNKLMPPGQLRRMSERFPHLGVALEQYVAGGILSELMRKVGPWDSKRRFPERAPSDAKLAGAVEAGTRLGMSELKGWVRKEASLLMRLADSDFRLEQFAEEEPG